MDTRTQHDIEPSGVASGILWHVKDFVTAQEVAAEVDCLTNGPSQILIAFYFITKKW